MKISIQKANEDDLPEIIRIYTQPEMDNSDVISLDQAKIIFKKMKSYPDYHLYVAINLESQIIGTFSLLIIDNLIHNGGISAILEAFAVDPAYQNQGIGKLMMQFAMKECQSKHCSKLELSSNSKNKKAHQFYESLGFRQHGISFFVEINQ